MYDKCFIWNIVPVEEGSWWLFYVKVKMWCGSSQASIHWFIVFFQWAFVPAQCHVFLFSRPWYGVWPIYLNCIIACFFFMLFSPTSSKYRWIKNAKTKKYICDMYLIFHKCLKIKYKTVNSRNIKYKTVNMFKCLVQDSSHWETTHSHCSSIMCLIPSEVFSLLWTCLVLCDTVLYQSLMC